MRIVYSESLSFVILHNPVTYSLECQQDTDRYPRSGCLHLLKVIQCRSVQSGCLTLHATWCYRIHKIISATWYYITLKWPRYITSNTNEFYDFRHLMEAAYHSHLGRLKMGWHVFWQISLYVK